MKNYSFKSLGNNKYEMFYKKDSLGITFITPDGYSMDDYEIDFGEEDFNPCKNVVIRLQNPPKKLREIEVTTNANITFEDGLSFCVSDSVVLRKNNNSVFFAKDGASEISVNTLMISGNKETLINFYPTPEGATTRDDKRLAGKGYRVDATFMSNENIAFKLQDHFVSYYIQLLKVNGLGSTVLDCTSSVFVTNYGGSFIVNGDKAEAKFKADRVEFNYTTINLEDTLGNGVATFENISKDKDELNSISFLGGCIDILGTAHITTDAKKLIINQQGNKSEDAISFSGHSFISAKEQVSIINGEFKGNNNIKSSSKELAFLSYNDGNSIKDSGVAIIPKSKKGKDEIIIKDFTANHVLLDNAKANVLTGKIYNAKIMNCEIGDESTINIAFSDPSLPIYATHINNLTLAKSSHLFLRSGVAIESEREINNCLVEEGKFSVLDDGDYKINNSTLSNGEIFLNNEAGLVTISNSNIKGTNEIKNITSIDRSILEEATIHSSKPVELRDEMIIDQKIDDYSAHLARSKQEEKGQRGRHAMLK